jgi:streptogramin lyase
MRSSFSSLLLLLSAPVLFALTGCGVSTNSAPYTMDGAGIQGTLHGGQQPVGQAHIYLMAASTSGYGSSSTSLITSAGAAGSDATGNYVLTDAAGTFNITGYSCTSNQQLYLLSLEGNPGLSGEVNATQIALMAPVGLCSSITSSTFVQINEISTVAMAYALAGFSSSPTQIASSGTSQGVRSLGNAFEMVGNLESGGLSLSTTPGGNGTVPQKEINTLADILAACVNTSSSGSSQCSTLFSSAESAGTSGTAPTNTAQAAINIAHNPGSVGISNLIKLATSTAPFQPTLSGTPADFSLAVTYTASGMGTPFMPAVDADGDLWVPNLNGPLVELSPVGKQLSPSGGFTGGGSPQGTAALVDGNGHVWVTNDGGVVEYNSAGQHLGTDAGGDPVGAQSYENLAVDIANDIWVADTAALGEYGSTGFALSPSTGYANGTEYFVDVRVDSVGVTWIADKDGFLSRYSPEGFLGQEYTDGAYGASAPIALAIDASNNIWVADSNTTEVSRFTNAGVQSIFSGGGTNLPNSIAVDGASSAWVANLGGTVSGFNKNGTAITPAKGYAIPANSNFVFAAADGSGNLWISLTGPATVMQFVGLTVPVITPIFPSQLGVKP